MESIYTFKERRWLYQQTKTVTQKDIQYILHIIRKNGDDYTVNSNGVFFDMERLSDESIRELMVYFKLLRRLAE
jgi:hypothetical protein